jgi:CRP-like cAMP-binding protein
MAACPNHMKAAVLQHGLRSLDAGLWLRESTGRKRAHRGDFLYRPGEPADPLYVVEEGLVKVSVCSSTGRDLTLGLYGPGEVFGEEAVLEDGRRVAFATALQPSVLIVVPRARLHAVIARDKEAASLLTRLLAARVRDSIRQLESIAWTPVPSRLAAALLRLAERNGVAEGGRTRLNLRLTHQELANLIGSTRETTTATLNGFRRRGWITLVRRSIVLVRPDLLAALAFGHHD